MNEPSDAAPLSDERQVGDDHRTAFPEVGNAERARARVLHGVLAPVAESMGFELVHAEWSSSGKRRRLQVYIDRPRNLDRPGTATEIVPAEGEPKGGVTLDDCARMSPIFGNALDAAEVAEPGGVLAAMLAGAYVLEVSSPGLERPLARLSHFQRYVGQRAKVRTLSPLAADSTQRSFHGRIKAATPDAAAPDDDHRGVVLLDDEEARVEHHIPVAHIRRAHLVYEG